MLDKLSKLRYSYHCKELKSFLRVLSLFTKSNRESGKGESGMTRKKCREMAFRLVREGKITTIGEFARLFHYANKLPRQKPTAKA
ncbi:MAG: hypothetical protein LBL65_05485 [Campylobacteraceae bacterium]|jgi:hypothetical protein|nr:hypothetical protein [Campylobacteraceae bacterium]